MSKISGQEMNRVVAAVFNLYDPSELARAIGVPRETTKKWKFRNSIPPPYWRSVSLVTGIPVERFEREQQ